MVEGLLGLDVEQLAEGVVVRVRAAGREHAVGHGVEGGKVFHLPVSRDFSRHGDGEGGGVVAFQDVWVKECHSLFFELIVNN